MERRRDWKTATHFQFLVIGAGVIFANEWSGGGGGGGDNGGGVDGTGAILGFFNQPSQRREQESRGEELRADGALVAFRLVSGVRNADNGWATARENSAFVGCDIVLPGCDIRVIALFLLFLPLLLLLLLLNTVFYKPSPSYYKSIPLLPIAPSLSLRFRLVSTTHLFH